MHKARAFFFVCAGLLALAFLLPRPAAAAWPTNPHVNVPLCTATGDQTYPQSVLDGAGGVIVTWQDDRSGDTYPTDIYAQRISADGTPQWTADGVALCTATGFQQNPTIVSDGVGGAIVAWSDNRGPSTGIYAQRVTATGAVRWATNGVALCTAVGARWATPSVSDGAGGAIATWEDHRNGKADIFAQRVGPAGLLGGTVDVPRGISLAFALDPVRPNPSRGGALTVRFTLPGAAAASL